LVWGGGGEGGGLGCGGGPSDREVRAEENCSNVDKQVDGDKKTCRVDPIKEEVRPVEGYSFDWRPSKRMQMHHEATTIPAFVIIFLAYPNRKKGGG